MFTKDQESQLGLRQSSDLEIDHRLSCGLSSLTMCSHETQSQQSITRPVPLPSSTVSGLPLPLSPSTLLSPSTESRANHKRFSEQLHESPIATPSGGVRAGLTRVSLSSISFTTMAGCSGTGIAGESFGDSSKSRGSGASLQQGVNPRSSTTALIGKGVCEGRFKKMLASRVVKRSHSAGCEKDVPAHALFLRYNVYGKTKSERKSVDTGRNNMDKTPSSNSDSESDQFPQEEALEGAAASCCDKTKRKSLASEMKGKFSFFRRRHTHAHLAEKEQSSKPSPEVAREWSKSIEILLADKCGVEMFRDFLRSEFSEENISFWIACEEYKQVKESKMASAAKKIYDNYVAEEAPHQINIDSQSRAATEAKMSTPDRTTFEVAQKRIQALMERDSHARFLLSEPYLELFGDSAGSSRGQALE